MLFNSFSYALFLPVVFILYWIMPQKSPLDYSSFPVIILYKLGPQYVAVILLTTLVSYAAALLMEGRHNGTLLFQDAAYGLGNNLYSNFILFKYFNFLQRILLRCFRKNRIPIQLFTLKLALPIGISFIFFRSLVIW